MYTKLLTASLLATCSLSLAGCGKEDPAAQAAARGGIQFRTICATCHGLAGTGLPNLGKDLTISEFVKTKSDEDLLAFIIQGRLPVGDTAAMPPRGGVPTLTDDQIKDIVTFVRSIQK